MNIHEQARAAILEADEYMANHRVTDSWRVISRLHGALVRLMDQAATRTRVVTTVTELDALFHAECDDVCTWNTLRLAFIETLGRWVADAVATEAVDEGLMPLVMTNPHAVDAGERPRGLVHDDRERIARNIEAVRDVHDDGVYTGLDIAVRIVREGA